ncbi:hypothetical protein EB061_03810 [bacterium]|jgi:hypothetical protein|nr:hypothetical protein [bacterium]
MVDPRHVLDPSCPWYDLRSLRLPKIKWCEEQLCSWVIEPANTWSNLGYILIGFLMMQLGKNHKSRALRLYGPAGVAVGVFSLIYHASVSFALQLFDFLGMYLFCYLLIFVNLERLGRRVIRNSLGPYLATVGTTTAVTMAVDVTDFPIQGLVLILIGVVFGTELLIRIRRGSTYSMKNFWISAAFIGAAAACSLADVKRFHCDPSNHWLQGHAMWHVLGSIALLFSYFHHRQFDEDLAR